MTKPGLVVVGFDDSRSALAAHRWAAHYARATAAVVRAVHVLTWPIGLAPTATRSGTRLHVPREDVETPYWRGLHRVFADVAMPAGSHLQFAQGNVADVLVRLSGTADLLVIGTRQPIQNHPYLAGSISRSCIAYATCPVVTVPADPVAPTKAAEGEPGLTAARRRLVVTLPPRAAGEGAASHRRHEEAVP